MLSLAVIFSLLIPTSVIADDLPPPPSPSTEETTSISDSQPATETAPDLLATPDSPTQQVLTETSIPLAEEDELDVLPILQSLPPDTTILIQVDDQIEPLASQAAQTALLVGDPLWCPDGTPPIANVGGCTASYIDLFSLIDDIDSGNIPEPSQNGIIWILAGADISSTVVEIDGSVFTSWRNFELTLQGGWDGTAAGTVTSTSVFSVPILITNWQDTVTVNQLEINGTTQTGLLVETTDNININGISSTNNALSGIELYGNDVSITGSIYLANNLSDGLYIEANGNIDAESISAINNAGYGAQLISFAGMTLTGANVFSDNTDSGIYVEAVTDINVSDISANNNGINGVNLISSTGNIALTGVNVFNGNAESGIYAEAFVDIVLENITADNNGSGGVFGNGAELYAQGNASINGINSLNTNNNSGLYIEAGGSIDLENIASDGNGGGGAELNSGATISLLGINIFTNNTETGLYVEATSDINAENITATDNGAGGVFGNGAEVFSQGIFSLTGVNIFSNNNNSGLYVEAANVDIENITANENGDGGAEILSTGDVSFNGVNVFNANTATGLYIESDGGINTENVFADNNGGNGAELYSLGDLSLTGTNVFTNNYDSGLYAEATGDINANNIVGSGNGAGGVYGSGAELYSLGDISLFGLNAFDNNFSTGIVLSGMNGVYVEYTDASNNGSSGIFIESNTDATVVCGVLSGNANYQLEADVIGTITLMGVDFGGDIDNDLGVDEDQLVLLSNSCFTYPIIPDDDDNDDGNDSDGFEIDYPSVDDLPIASYFGVNGNTIALDCTAYKGTILTLINGDGAYIPCPIIDSARLIDVPMSALSPLPQGMKFISAFILDIYRDGKIIDLQSHSGLIDFSKANNPLDSGFTYVYWDGNEWVDVTDQTYPYMKVFFVPPIDMEAGAFAILYWDGLIWVELIDGLQLGNGRAVGQGIHLDENLRFSASVNFTGTFVLVQKTE